MNNQQIIMEHVLDRILSYDRAMSISSWNQRFIKGGNEFEIWAIKVVIQVAL